MSNSGPSAACVTAGSAARLRRAGLIMVACWALPGGAAGAGAVILSSMPTPTPDRRPIPLWLWIGGDPRGS
jgi:hypothetical protein